MRDTRPNSRAVLQPSLPISNWQPPGKTRGKIRSKSGMASGWILIDFPSHGLSIKIAVKETGPSVIKETGPRK
jgi:hypothetical protein